MNNDKVRRQLQHDIHDHLARHDNFVPQEEASRNSLFSLDEQRQATKEISLACSNLEKLLDDLENHASLRTMDSSKPPKSDAIAHAEPDQLRGEVRRLRAFAADDTTMETTSVADYAADPEAPDMFRDTVFETEAVEMTTSVSKIQQSIQTLTVILNENPQWWNSPILVRRIKTHAIRSNYHSRKARVWGDHLRAHLLVSTTSLNKTSLEAQSELLELQKQAELCSKKVSDLDARKSALRKEAHQLQEEKGKLDAQSKLLLSQILNIGEENDVFRPDLSRMETILLLTKLGENVPSLTSDCRCVVSWLSGCQVLL